MKLICRCWFYLYVHDEQQLLYMWTVKGNMPVPITALITVKFFLPVCSSMVYLLPETKLWTKPTHGQLWQRFSFVTPVLWPPCPCMTCSAPPKGRTSLALQCRQTLVSMCQSQGWEISNTPFLCSASAFWTAIELSGDSCDFMIWVVAALPVFSKTHKAFWSGFLRYLSNVFASLILVFTVLNLKILDCDPQILKNKF